MSSSADAPPRERVPALRRMSLRRILTMLTALGVCAALLLTAPRAALHLLAGDDVTSRPGDIPRLTSGQHRAAIVLGAGIRDGRPTPVLRDRIDAAVRLYREHRVDRIIMSGDNSTADYDEPSAMRETAIEAGIPAERVIPDFAGRRTWDSCVRAHDVFGLRSAVVVTSEFHIDRAVVSCRAANVHVTGLSVSDAHFPQNDRTAWRLRELAASARVLLDAYVLRPSPAVGGSRIDINDPCAVAQALPRTALAPDRARFAHLGCQVD